MTNNVSESAGTAHRRKNVGLTPLISGYDKIPPYSVKDQGLGVFQLHVLSEFAYLHLHLFQGLATHRVTSTKERATFSLPITF